MKKICEVCGREFEGRPNKNVCSPQCRSRRDYLRNKQRKAAAREQEKKPEKAEPVQLVCARCGKTFTSGNGQRKYCGEECANAARREQRLEWGKTHRRKKACKFCGKSFTPNKPNQKFCCRTCANSYHLYDKPSRAVREAKKKQPQEEEKKIIRGVERREDGSIRAPGSFAYMAARSRAEHRSYGEIMTEHLSRQVRL